VVRLAVFRDLQNPAGLPALAAGLLLADEPAWQGDLQAYEERESAGGGPGSAAYPGRSAAWSFVLREAVPLSEETVFFAPVAGSQSDSRVPLVQRTELRAALIVGREEEAVPSVRQ